MEITLNEHKVQIQDKAFTMQSDLWLFDTRITDVERVKLMRLYWRYDFFRSNAKNGTPCTNYMYCTQESYSDLLGLSRSKIPKLLDKLESCNYLVRIKCGKHTIVDGDVRIVPRDYIVVLNPSHTDYENELTDVWKALSGRISKLKEHGKTTSRPYTQMMASYTRLFSDKPFHTVNSPVETILPEKDVYSFGIVCGGEAEPPIYEIPPISCYNDSCVAPEDNTLSDFILLDTEPPF